jgi:sterol desaturase/sphingolipid hydroxylase (fatty acid hydroxylase superfamily)
MHRIHHSDYSEETNSNYGFCLTWWDRLFKTYNEVSVSGERKLVFGLEEYRDPKYQSLINLLLLPLDLRYLRVKQIKRQKTKMKDY